VQNDWYDKMLEDESFCDPICPPEGKLALVDVRVVA
jgi:hypothetical protein